MRASWERARAELMQGRGPGADEEEIAAHTRNRVVVAGMSATRRLELAARDTARARGDASQMTDAVQQRDAERAHPQQSLGRDYPVGGQSAARREVKTRSAAARSGGRYLLLGAAALLIGWRLRRGARPGIGAGDAASAARSRR